MHNYYKLGNRIQLPNLSPSIRDRDYAPFAFSKFQTYQPLFSMLFRSASKKRPRAPAAEHPLNNIVLNHRFHVVDETTVCDAETGKHLHRRVYFKFAPLLSPFAYLMGEYGAYTRDAPALTCLPSADSAGECHPNLRSPFNSGYVDAMCSYLFDLMREKHGLFPALRFYGSFSGVQDTFRMSMAEADIRDVEGATFFERGVGKHFHAGAVASDDGFESESASLGTTFSRRVGVGASRPYDPCRGVPPPHPLGGAPPLHPAPADAKAKAIEVPAKLPENNTTHPAEIGDNEMIECTLDAESLNSGVSGLSGIDTECESIPETADWQSESTSPDDDSISVATQGSHKLIPPRLARACDFDGDSSEPWFIHHFPVQIIAMDRCDGTLEELISQKRLTDPIAKLAMLFQITAYLAAAQHALQFTHNDLHSSNVFWSSTTAPYFYYRAGEQNFRVPTFGRMFHVADFGRSIFSYDGITFASDAFFAGGDAEGQYNCEPFFDPKRPRIDRNFSVDLCRLATTLFDIEFLSPSDSPTDAFQTLVRDWCLDDKGDNVLWTRDGKKRYREFKLYKMMTRKVHNHIPSKELMRPEFNVFAAQQIPDKTKFFLNVGAFRPYDP